MSLTNDDLFLQHITQKSMYEWMDGWMDGWMNERMNEWMQNEHIPSILYINASPHVLITVTSLECHGISNHPQCKCLYNSLFRLTTKTSKLHQWPVDSLHKGRVMQKIHIYHVTLTYQTCPKPQTNKMLLLLLLLHGLRIYKKHPYHRVFLVGVDFNFPETYLYL